MAANNSPVLFTSGYAGLSIEQFLLRLRSHGITMVIDVRQLPISRKHDFSKSQLRQTLEDNGFSYVHFPQLGSPAELRAQLKQGLDLAVFFARYEAHLDQQVEPLYELLELVRREPCCLICVESSPQQCHRSHVAARIQKLDGNGLGICHL